MDNNNNVKIELLGSYYKVHEDMYRLMTRFETKLSDFGINYSYASRIESSYDDCNETNFFRIIYEFTDGTELTNPAIEKILKYVNAKTYDDLTRDSDISGFSIKIIDPLGIMERDKSELEIIRDMADGYIDNNIFIGISEFLDKYLKRVNASIYTLEDIEKVIRSYKLQYINRCERERNIAIERASYIKTLLSKIATEDMADDSPEKLSITHANTIISTMKGE